jgi:MFS family permease
MPRFFRFDAGLQPSANRPEAFSAPSLSRPGTSRDPPGLEGTAPAAETAPEWSDRRFQKLLFVQMAFGYAFSSLLVVPKFATTALHASPREVGEIAACSALAGIATAPLCGRWLDRGGARRVVLLGAALLTLSLFPLGSFHAVEPAVFFARAVQGIGNTLVIGGTAVYVTLLVPRAHHARAFGLVGSAALAMNAIASYTTERLAATYGWELAFQVAAASTLLACALATSMPELAPNVSNEPVPSSSATPAAKSSVTWAALAGGAAFATIATFTQPYILEKGGRDVAPLFIGYTVTALGVRLGLGGVIDRWGRRRTALLALVIHTVTLLSAAFVRPDWLFVLGLGFGAAHGMAWPSLNALAVEHAPQGRHGSALTRLHAFFGLGGMSAVWGVGWLVDAIGYPLSFAIAAGFVAAGATTLRRRVPAVA